eukprot:TRINITY_DN8099_c1_g1_i4.p2 TRINITY_DN8099_c1_g1~~TRINITY_DN8099_c1_g1_i4.p2  ORF type:complete len:342 (-),score=36.44 TRINITY_DN8099_c1_g1_i4:112-1116(-)
MPSTLTVFCSLTIGYIIGLIQGNWKYISSQVHEFLNSKNISQQKELDATPIKQEIIDRIKSQLKSFLERILERKIVCITSGGTIVPLEQRCVRFVDNFSQGGRGARSTEEFIKEGYAVILLRRKGSYKPFQELHPSISSLQQDPSQQNLSKQLENLKMLNDEFEKIKDSGSLLEIEFESVFQYLEYLKTIALDLQALGDRVMFFLAAAVSDFYVPWEKLPEHKVQSNAGDLELKLQQVPKMLGCLKQEWAPNAFVVSFKLETNEDILKRKAEEAAKKYGMDAVVANLLHTRNDRVLVLHPQEQMWQTIDRNDFDRIEHPLVQYIVKLHESFIQK